MDGLSGFFSALYQGLSFVMSLIDRKTAADQFNSTQSFNVAATNATNANNRKMVEMTNQANAEQAELAYQRSKPANQVANMRAAGMSLPAALGVLSHGGSFSPVPFTSSTDVAPHVDNPPDLGLSNLIERLSSMPANVTQQIANEQALESARQEYEHRQNAEHRAQQEHDMKMDEMLYNKWERDNMNEFMGLMTSVAHDKNIEPADNESFHKFIRRLGLQDNKLFHQLPISAHERVFNYYKQQLQEQREQQDSLDKHKISDVTKRKLDAELTDFNDAKSARLKEYKLRNITATLEQIARSRDLILDKKSIQDVFEFDKNGNIIFENGFPKYKVKKTPFGTESGVDLYSHVRSFWNDVSEIIPVNILAQVFRFILKQ